MKKLVALLLAAVFCMSIVFTASASQEVTIQDKNFVIVETDYSNYGYLFAKIENTGNEPVFLDNGKLVVFATGDDLAATDDYITAYPNYLAPGEFAYVSDYTSLDIGAADCEDFKFSIKTKDSVWTQTAQFPCADAEVIINDDSWNKYQVIAEVTNPTESVIFDFDVVYAVYDANGNFLCTEINHIYDVGLVPGATILVKDSIDSKVMEIFEGLGATPASVEAIVVYEVE